MIASVIVDIAHSEVDKIFDYNCPFDDAEIGVRVVVPFGNMKIEGVIFEIKDFTDCPIDKLKSIIRIIDEKSVITKECFKLALFMKNKYHIPLALALRQLLPSEMRKGKVREKTARFISFSKDFDCESYLNSPPTSAKKQREVVEFLVNKEKIRSADLKKMYSPSAVSSLVSKGILVETEEAVKRLPYIELEARHGELELTGEQRVAVLNVESTNKQVTLIHGVTGSGKTAIYVELIKRVLASNKNALMLVPEIALTPQMLAEMRFNFGDKAAILHSGLSAGEKFDEWWRLRDGDAKIVIGARSAIFAPLENLGLIVIDEEHDGSYESESNPRYSTIDIAKFRADYNNCKIVLGSATPSIETYLYATEGTYNLVTLKNRINHRPMPEMIISDMRDEIRRGNNSTFSSALKQELETCLKNKNQAIIFINRRGYSQQIICRQCGYVAKCENCDVSLNYHVVDNLLKCHYCGASYHLPKACPECGSVHINYVGTGTQKVVSELNKIFPEARILRMDNDTTKNKEGHFKIINEFAEKKADILVGTQMIAKGHDFPKVTLVGILDADMSLFFSDYRSSERTFQLITQVAGRSGRAEEGGKVVLQTFAPKNSVLNFAINYDYNGFFEREIAIRKATAFPPYSVILRVMVESIDNDLALETLKSLYGELKEVYEKRTSDFLFFNKMRSPIKRLKSKFRYQVLMRISKSAETLIEEIYQISLKYTTPKVLVYVESNPANLS